METGPRLDASRPSNLRLASFGAAALGALSMGIGSLLTWVTYGIRHPGDVPTEVPGTDDVAGRIVLIASIVVLAAVVGARLVTAPRRRLLAWTVGVLGVVAIGTSVWFIVTATDRYAAIPPDAAAGSTVASYADVGPGPWIAIVGGVVVIVGGFLTLRWASQLSNTPTPLPPH